MKQLLADYLNIYHGFIEQVGWSVFSGEPNCVVTYWTHETKDNKAKAIVPLSELLTFIYNKEK